MRSVKVGKARKPVMICLVGMSGPPSGAWTRLGQVVSALVGEGVEVHILGEVGIHDGAVDFGVATVKLIFPMGKIARALSLPRLVAKLARETGCAFIHLEAPPFIGPKGFFTLASLHDLRHFDQSWGQKFSTERFYQRHILGWFAPNISGWLVLTEWGRYELHRRFRFPLKTIFAIPPSIPVSNKYGPRHGNNLTEYVLVLGHLEPRKNIETLISAVRLPTWPDDLELWIAGSDGGSLSRLVEMARVVGSRVRFLGKVENSEKEELLEKARIVAVPSLSEGFGIVAIEAPLSGTVALVSDVQPLAEIGAHPSSRVVPTDPVAWANRIAAVHGDEALYAEILDRQQSYARDLAPHHYGSRLLSVYDAVTASLQ